MATLPGDTYYAATRLDDKDGTSVPPLVYFGDMKWLFPPLRSAVPMPDTVDKLAIYPRHRLY